MKNLSFIAFLAATNLIPSVGYTISDSAGVALDANVAQTNRINAANLPVTPQLGRPIMPLWPWVRLFLVV